MPRPRPLRFHLLRLALAGLIPTALFAGALMVLLWRQQQTELFRSLEDTARAVSLAVDREVEISIKRLEVLSNQDTFREERWEEFDRQCRRLVAISEDWVNVLAFTAEGQELINVRLGYAGPPKPQPESLEYVQQVIRERRPMISNLFVSPHTGEQVVHVAFPVFREGRPPLVLAASLNLGGFDRLLTDQSTRQREGIAAIFDRNLRFVARSRDSHEYLGMLPVEPQREGLLQQDSGTRRLPTYDGPDVYSAWTRSESNGWVVSYGVPAAPVETSLRRSLLMLGGVGLIVLLATVLVALHIGRRLAAVMAEATESAMALARGEPLPPLESGVSELNVLGDALERASRILENESEERARAEHERELLLEREQQARHEAEAAGRAKDEFLAMLGHELRNPLAPILFAIELAKTHPDELPKRELEVIERQARHIERLVNDLLDIARIVRGKVSINKQVEEIHPIVSKAVEIAAPLLETKQHVLQLDVPKHGLQVEADETRLAQVIANLLTNAAKFTAPGGEIELSAGREGDTVLVRVRDTGIGIAPELLPNVFDIFMQGKRSNEAAQGLGLGLALVRSFVRLHGGTVTAYSDGLNRGSEFIIRLPAVEAGATHDSKATLAAVTTTPARILVVDDNEDAADSLGRLLTVRGYDVRIANDGRRALELAHSFHPQLAIVDLGMPVMDGYQVAQELARMGKRPFLIAVTGYGQEHDRERARAAGFDRHMIKPVAVTQLLAYIEDAAQDARPATAQLNRTSSRRSR
jgi:signal transduction histidine kinase/CheY-like chemotaxis protein